MIASKVCTKCNVDTPLENMGRASRSKDGYNIYCKPCIRQQSQQKRDANPELNKAWQAAYRDSHRNQERSRGLARYYSQKDRLLELNHIRRQRDYDHVRAIEKASYERNKDRRRPVKNAKQSIRNRLIGKSEFVVLEKELKRIYLSKCVSCGTHDRMSIDHIIPLARGGRHSIGNLQPMCTPCNSSKQDKTMMEWKLVMKGRD
jgi:5-methylcytosine-specific restriction endonuclease McrA